MFDFLSAFRKAKPIVTPSSATVATYLNPFSLSQKKVTPDTAMNHTAFFTCVFQFLMLQD